MGRFAVGIPLAVWLTVLGFILGGCSEDPWDKNPPEPKMACVWSHIEQGQGRYGPYPVEVCDKRELRCPFPSELREAEVDSWGSRKMECRLKN